MDFKDGVLKFFFNDVCYNMRRASNPLTRLCNKALKIEGLPLESTQYYLLLALYHAYPATLGFACLANIVLVDRTTVSRVIAPLVKKGFVIVDSRESDRRFHYCILSESGKKLVEKALPVFNEIDAFIKNEIAHGAQLSYSYLNTGLMKEIIKVGSEASSIEWKKESKKS